MADHDRDAGPRGEEEAPRGSTPDEAAVSPSERDTDVHPTQPDLKYGEIPPGPQMDPEDTTTAHTMPRAAGWDTSQQQQPPRSDSFRGFVRQKPAQIIGAGLVGLLLGAVLGGTAVGVVANAADRHDRHGFHGEWGPRRGMMMPDRLDESCYSPQPGVVFCGGPSSGEDVPAPAPVRTG
jgi:hypothetical protein